MERFSAHAKDLEESLQPHLALGAAVLRQAIADQQRGDYLGDEARAFLHGGLAFPLWVELLGLDPAAVRNHLRSGRQP